MREVCDYLGITPVRMTNLRYAVNAVFPAPIRALKAGNLWDLDDVLAYARLYPSKIGSPDAPVRAEL